MSKHPITPPPELVEKLRKDAPRGIRDAGVTRERHLVIAASRWGADQELIALLTWLLVHHYDNLASDLQAARRPKPLGLAEQALEERSSSSLTELRSSPADGEMAELVELVEWLRVSAAGNDRIGATTAAAQLNRAAELLQRQAQQTLPQGLIPMEYVDADSSARIVSEPSEDGPGGCWVVRNSRHVNPCTEFPTAEAAWDALQRAQSLPSTVGPFDRIKFTCHLVPREQADG